MPADFSTLFVIIFSVYWVPGNHEYYGSDITDKQDPLFEKIRDNLFLVNNCSVVHEGVRLIFTTLWSRISPQLHWDMQRSVSDFSAIRFREENLTPRNFSLLHEESLRFMKTALSEGGENSTVVVTHHVPTLMNYPGSIRTAP
ncbi:metallophosphoesterase [Puia sp. P3]|uniref:metallophosphoesterase n=1 Tax=Puia sp. P3 TaxID=3423952 RepID=UPI003D67F9F2